MPDMTSLATFGRLENEFAVGAKDVFKVRLRSKRSADLRNVDSLGKLISFTLIYQGFCFVDKLVCLHSI